MNWISITKKLPPFNKSVLFRGENTWNSEYEITYFDDELTMDEEHLEYGNSAYLLKINSDWLVSQNPYINELCEQFITHWCELPTDLDLGIISEDENPMGKRM